MKRKITGNMNAVKHKNKPVFSTIANIVTMQTSFRVATTNNSSVLSGVEYNRGVFRINIPPQAQGVLQQPMRVVMYITPPQKWHSSFRR